MGWCSFWLSGTGCVAGYSILTSSKTEKTGACVMLWLPAFENRKKLVVHEMAGNISGTSSKKEDACHDHHLERTAKIIVVRYFVSLKTPEQRTPFKPTEKSSYNKMAILLVFTALLYRYSTLIYHEIREIGLGLKSCGK